MRRSWLNAHSRRKSRSSASAEGEEFRGEGILAVTKALLQAGVGYVGGYQGAPISHLMDVLSDAQGVLKELGVHFEASASEAAAAAMLAASVNYPIRGAVTWKSTVGTNVASDALANVASGGVTGGALIVIGEDYGEGSSIMQERSHAFAMKSQIWLLDPRPNLEEHRRDGGAGIRALRGIEHAGHAGAADSRLPRLRALLAPRTTGGPPSRFKTLSIIPCATCRGSCLPPASFQHEQEKIQKRWPAALAFIREHRLNEFLGGSDGDVGIIVQGGLYNTLLRALELVGAGRFARQHARCRSMSSTSPIRCSMRKSPASAQARARY